MRLIAVVMGTASKLARKEESRKLLGYGFRFYETPRVLAAGQSLTDPPLKVWKGAADSVRLGVTRDVYVTVPRGRAAELKASYVVDEAHRAIVAPVAAGDVLGSVTVSLGEELVQQEPLAALDGVERGGFFRTREGDQDLLVRARQTYEGAVPSGASVAIELLLRLYQLTGAADYDRAARRAFEVMVPAALANPYGASHLLSVGHRAFLGYTAVVVVEASGSEDKARALSDAAVLTHAPECSVLSSRAPLPDWLHAAI